MATNAATLFLDIDSRMALDAAKKLQQLGASADKAGREADRLAAKFDKNYTTTKKLTQEYKDLDTAFNVGYLSAQQYAAGVQQVDAALDAMKTGGAQAVNSLHAVDKAMGSSTHHSTNLMFQLQDIGMMMAAGQNPFMLMLQQGSQVAGVFGQIQAEGKKIGPTIAGAFTQLLNPMTAVTFAVIGGSAALVQWAVSAFSASGDADKLGDALDDMMGSLGGSKSAMEAAKASTYELRMEYGAMAGAARDALDQQVALSQFNLTSGIRATQAEIKTLGGDVAYYVEAIQDLNAALARGNLSYSERSLALEGILGYEEEIADRFNMTVSEAEALVATIDDLGSASGLGDVQAKTAALVAEFIRATDSGAKLPPEMAKFVTELGNANLEMIDLIGLAGQLGTVLSTITVPNMAGMTYGSTSWYWGQTAEDLLPPTPGLAPDKPDGRRGRGGGGKSEAERLRDEMKDRLETLQKGFMAESALEMQQYALDQETIKWALDQRMITLAEYKDREAQLRTMTWGTETEMANLQYQAELQGLNAALEQKYLTQAAYNERVRALEQEHQDTMRGLQNWSWQENLNGMASVFGAMAELQGGNNEKMLRAQRTFAAASALINAYEAGSQVLRDPTLPWFAKIGAAGSIIAAGLGMVSAIKGGGAGGSSSASRAAAPAPAQQKAEPVKNVLVKLEGDAMFMDMAENIMQQIYRQSENGRVIIARG